MWISMCILCKLIFESECLGLETVLCIMWALSELVVDFQRELKLVTCRAHVGAVVKEPSNEMKHLLVNKSTPPPAPLYQHRTNM